MSGDWLRALASANARLSKLAPDLALLCADMGHWIDVVTAYFEAAEGQNITVSSGRDLLARLAALQPEETS